MHQRIKYSDVRKHKDALFLKHFYILLRVNPKERGGSSSNSRMQAVQWCCKIQAVLLVLHRVHLCDRIQGFECIGLNYLMYYLSSQRLQHQADVPPALHLCCNSLNKTICWYR